jgi:two-component system cell cycle sensor histidine kinase/response regulator CckA
MRSEPKRSVEADEFVLRDTNGLMRAALKMTADGPCLFFYDHREKIRAGLVGGKSAPRLFLLDRDGKPRASLGLAAGDTAETRYQALAAASGQLVWTTDAAGEVVEDLPSWSTFTGQSEEEFKGAGWRQAIHPGDRERVEALSKKAQETHEPYDAEYRLRRQDGEYRDFAVRAAPVIQIDDAIGEWIVAATDISERKRLEESLRASEERLAASVATHNQLEETLRVSEEGRNALMASNAQLQESLRSNEERLIASNAANSQLQETLRVKEDQRNTLTAANTQLQESLRVSEESRNALSASSAQLQESLRASDDRLAALTTSRTQLEETLRVSDEQRGALTAASTQLQESLRSSEERLAGLTTSKTQLEEALRVSEEQRTALTAAGAQLQESLRSSEERLAALTTSKTQLEEALRASEEQRTALTIAGTQLQESLRASEERFVVLTASKTQVDEALRASEEQRSALSVAHTQLQESSQANELTHTTEQKRVEEALQASEERVGALGAAKAHLEETLRLSGEAHSAGRRQFEEALRAIQEQLNDQIVAKGQVEETLRAREEHYKALTAATAQLVWTTNYAGELIEVAPSWMTFTGQSADDAKGRGWLQPLHPEDRARAEEALKLALETRSPYKTEYRLRRHDGAYRVLAVRGAPVVEYDGAVYEWIGTAIDITEEKEGEEQRRASEKKYRQIVEQAPEGIWIIDPDNRTTFANPKLAQMLGWSEQEMPGKSLFDFLDEEGRKSAEENLACCRRGVAMQFDLTLRSMAGQEIRTRASTLPLFDEVGLYSGALALIVDVTDQKIMEGQQVRAQKLNALGQLAGGVAHTLNNLLTVINGYTDLLLGKVPRSNPMHESVAQIKKAGEQAAGLVSPLLAFSQGQILWARSLDVNEVVTDVEKRLRGQLGADVRLTTLLSPALGPVKADPEQLQHVLINLTANALDAMRGRGSLVLETQNVDLDESYAAKHLGVNPGPYVHLSVSDSGTGMSEETLAHLFEPFFTTKNQEKGAGLGLATAYGIVKQSGGSITVESELDKGSTFHVYLPRVGEAVSLPEGGRPAVTTLRGTETILIVEDQEEVRKLAQLVLKSYGYKVVLAANGWEALLYSERHVGPIHLMLTDVLMPGMTGQELADRLRPLRPEMVVVFMSGYMENGMVNSHSLKSGAEFFLAKPFSPDTLAKKVREVLGPPRSAGMILVIDGEEDTRNFMQTVLGSVGFAVLDADGGEQAIKHLDGEEVDLILVDLGQSGQHELDMIRTYQQRRPNLKVIAMSATFGDEFLRAAEALGARATLAKPVRADQLLETVRRTMAQ